MTEPTPLLRLPRKEVLLWRLAGGLARDLEAYLHFYNEERAHTGRLTQGQTPCRCSWAPGP